MFRLAANLTQTAPRLASQKQRRTFVSDATSHGGLTMTKYQLEKLSAAVRRYTPNTAHIQVLPIHQSAVQQHATTPLPRPRRCITPYMMHRCMSTSTTAGNETWKPFHATTTDGATQSTRSVVRATPGMGDFLANVYATTGASILSTLALSYGLVKYLGITSVATAIGGIWVGGAAALLGSVYAVASMKPRETIHHANGSISTVNTWARKAAFATMIASSAVVMTPLMFLASSTAPWIIPSALLATAGTMSAAGACAMHVPNGSLLKYQTPMIGALGGLVALSLVGSASVLLIGPNALSIALLTPQPYLVLLIFTALTAGDTSVAVHEYRQGSADHLRHAVEFYLNGINMIEAYARIILRNPLI